MVSAYWEDHYLQLRLEGKEEEEVEDEEFDEVDVAALMERHPEDWMMYVTGELQE